MPITRWAPEPMRSFERFNKMMEEVFGTSDGFRGMWTPSVDIKEDKNNLMFLVELPGLTEKDVEVELNGGLLTIRGSRDFNKEEKREDYVCIERSYGSFQRTFSLDVPVKTDAINATFKEGILTVTVPKLESRTPKKIAVKHA